VVEVGCGWGWVCVWVCELEWDTTQHTKTKIQTNHSHTTKHTTQTHQPHHTNTTPHNHTHHTNKPNTKCALSQFSREHHTRNCYGQPLPLPARMRLVACSAPIQSPTAMGIAGISRAVLAGGYCVAPTRQPHRIAVSALRELLPSLFALGAQGTANSRRALTGVL
jgi:hypothetical protein